MERGGQGAESAGYAHPASGEDHVISGIWAGLSKGLQPPPRYLPFTRALLANYREGLDRQPRDVRDTCGPFFICANLPSFQDLPHNYPASDLTPGANVLSICFSTSTSSERGRWVTLAFAPGPRTKMADPWNIAGVVVAGTKLLWDFGIFWKDSADAPEEARKCLNPSHADPTHPGPGRLTAASSRRAEIHSQHTPTERPERAECLGRGQEP